MKIKYRPILIFFTIIVLAAIFLFVINGTQNSTPIMSGVISNKHFDSFAEMEAVETQESVLKDEDIIATIHYIESPNGTEYKIIWEQNDSEIYTDKLSIVGDTEGILEFKLDKGKAQSGELTAVIYYKEKPIYELTTNVK